MAGGGGQVATSDLSMHICRDAPTQKRQTEQLTGVARSIQHTHTHTHARVEGSLGGTTRCFSVREREKERERDKSGKTLSKWEKESRIPTATARAIVRLCKEKEGEIKKR